MKRSTAFFVALALDTALALGAETPEQQEAAQILDATNIKGGLVVQLGCGDGKLTAALHANDSYLVQGLDTDPKAVATAREHIRSLDLYGPVAVAQWSGRRLPFIENLANLVVSENAGAVPIEEILRVLAPGGVAYIKGGDGAWTKTVKPRPKNIDEWTHYLHDPSNNAVAHDDVVAPPGRLQWITGPRYSRHHDHMSATSAMVSAAGRNFSIIDEGSRESIFLPSDWKLVARDAFNGTLLWKQAIGRWHTQLWPLKSGPQMLTRRLVASGDRVYVTLAIDAPLAELDAATGKILKTYGGTGATEEILFADGILYLVVSDPENLHSKPDRTFSSVGEISELHKTQSWGAAPRALVAVDARSGAVRWRKEYPVTPMTLAVDGERVYFHDGGKVVCLGRADGAEKWVSKPIPLPEYMPSQGAAVLVVQDGVVVFAGGLDEEAGRKGKRGIGVCGLSARDGAPLWQSTQPFVWGGALRDALVVDGLLWSGDVAGGDDSGTMTGRDLHTGEIRKQFPPDADIYWFHHRCYRAKATDNYLLYSRTGIEFVDLEKSHWITHHWVRGGCLYGVMPCNGLVYNPPHPCACYSDAKLYGFNALAPITKDWTPPREVPDEGRLEQGPAFAQIGNQPSAIENGGDWPTYRHDASRSGATPTAVPATGLRQAWETPLRSRLSPPTIAEGKILVSAIDSHAVHALDEQTGRPLWCFTAGGRVDSPPTIWRGRVLFGSADGHVYCLRASDGALAWRFRAAPEDRRLGAFDQIESVWPVSGAVLIQNDTVYCVAGRSMFLDGGLRMLRLDPGTGRKISETILDDRDPETNQNLQGHVKGLDMPAALPDVLSSDGRHVYMRTLPFDLEGKRKYVGHADVLEQEGDDVHLFSPTGFLDDTLWHRTYWVYGRAWASGAGGYSKAGQIAPAGRLLVFDDAKVYGYGRLPEYYRWTTPMEFRLFAMEKHPEIIRSAKDKDAAGLPKKERKATQKTNPKGPPTQVADLWSAELPVQADAMALAGRTLFVAGPPDVLDEAQAERALDSPDTQKKAAEQAAALLGQRGAVLRAISADDGKTLAEYKLDAPPLFDGMATANGRLFLSTMDGRVVSWAAE